MARVLGFAHFLRALELKLRFSYRVRASPYLASLSLALVIELPEALKK